MTVEILCPHCGFSRKVPLEKIPPGVRRANCPRCRNQFELNLQAPAGGAGGAEQEGAGRTQEHSRGAPPWERRSELSLWAAFFGTTKGVLLSPRGLFAGMGYEAGLREPLAYGLLTGSLGAMVGLFWQFLWMSDALYSLAGRYLEAFSMGLAFAVCLVLAPLYTLVALCLESLILHACLAVVRAGKNGFQATFRAVAYSQATQLLSFVPFVGGLAALAWHCIVLLIGLREIHGVSYGKIIFAFLIPFVLTLLVMAGLAVTFSFLLLR